MRPSAIRRRIGIGFLSGILALSAARGVHAEPQRAIESTPKNKITLSVPIKAPIEEKAGKKYDPNAPGRCSAYAVRIANKVFGIKYNRADAWELAKNNKVILSANTANRAEQIGKNTLLEKIKSGEIKPGYLVTSWNPNSKYKKNYETHVVIYMGMAPEGPIFWENANGVRKSTLSDIYRNGIMVRRVLAPNQPLVASTGSIKAKGKS